VALWFRGSVYYEKGDYDGAIRDFTEVIGFQPEVNVTNVSEIYQRGLARFYQGDYEGADGLLRAAKQDDLTDTNPCNCDESSANLKKKASSHVSEGSAYFYLGEDALLRGNLQEARRLFERALTNGSKEFRGVSRFGRGAEPRGT